MRYEFRGKVSDEPYEWVYGYLINDNTISQVQENSNPKACSLGTFTVDPNSIGLGSCFKDSQMIRIYENDIVKSGEYYYLISFKMGSFLATNLINIDEETFPLEVLLRERPVKIIGNMYEVE